MEEKDCYLKDEGDFFTLIFQSEKALKVLSENKDLSEMTYSFGTGTCLKVDLPMELLSDTLILLNDNQLSFDTEF